MRSCWDLCKRCLKGGGYRTEEEGAESDFKLAINKSKEDEANKIDGWKKKEATNDAMILEQTIVKVGALLALGFGEAGVKIISDNMGHTGDVDPMIPGNKVVAIFGFCDIR